MKELRRIITYMGYSDSPNPQKLLQRGSAVYTLPPSTRRYEVRIVVYDENMTPVYAKPIFMKPDYSDTETLFKHEMRPKDLKDHPILDLDNSLRVFNP